MMSCILRYFFLFTILSLNISGYGQSIKIVIDTDYYNTVYDTNKYKGMGIANVGSQNLKIDSIEFIGDNSFEIDTTGMAHLLLPNGYEFIHIYFLPKDTNNHIATVKIFSNDPTHSILSYTFSGRGYAPNILVKAGFNSIINNGSTHNIGSVSYGDSMAYRFQISNTGDGILHINNIRLLTGSTDFRIDTIQYLPSLVDNNSFPVTLIFRPSSLGIKNAIFEITSNTLGHDSAFQVSVTANSLDQSAIAVRQGNLHVDQSYLFYYVENGTTKTENFTIKNNAFKTLEIFSIKLNDITGTYVLDTTRLSHSISAFDSTMFSIAYSPVSSTFNQCYLTIINNDLSRDTLNLSLLGSGTTAVLNEMTSDNNISLFPNPTSQNINIHSIDDNIEQVRIINVLGNEVMNVTSSGNTQIDISSLPKGFYNFIITTDKGVGTKKVSVQ